MTLIISETSTSTFNYHLRRIDDLVGPKYSGDSNLIALCGQKLGWDITMPITAYGLKSHVPYKWCKKCKELACI